MFMIIVEIKKFCTSYLTIVKKNLFVQLGLIDCIVRNYPIEWYIPRVGIYLYLALKLIAISNP